ncbi:MAG: thioredoxin [Bacteroidota bacterium]
MVDFQSQVIARSHEIPVVVDFWAPWCGPCRTLGPLIEQMASEAAGAWELVKVNTEEQQDIAQQYQIMSIPAVKMFWQGQVKGEFVGALPRHQIDQWLKQNLPDHAKEAFSGLLQAWEVQDPASLSQRLEAFEAENPGHAQVSLAKAFIHLPENPALAEEVLAQTPQTGENKDWIEDLQALHAFLQTPAAGPESFVDAFSTAQRAFRAREWEAALKALIQAVMVDKQFEDELPRRATVALMRRLGQQHPLSRQYDRMFSMALY